MSLSSSNLYTVTICDGLTGSRAAVINETGPIIPEVKLYPFFTQVLPSPSIVKKTPSIFKSLSTGTNPVYADGRWIAFPDDLANTKEPETVIFQSLARVVEAVVKQTELSFSVEALTSFTNDPDLIPESQWRQSSGCPDSLFVLRKRWSVTAAYWADVAATGEFKRRKAGCRRIDDESKKMLWNMNQTLRNDPCRRFTFGFTIEGSSMRIWFCSRAEILVCQPFDFISEPMYLVRFILALTYANECELGWDPTMQLVSSPVPHYIIAVRSPQGEEMLFETEELLSDANAKAIRGRATRVWKVRQCIDGHAIGPSMVLKDCWLDAGQPCEGEVTEKILASAATKPEHDKVLRRGFLTTVIHGDVHVADGVVDCTPPDRESILQGDHWFLVHRSDELVRRFAGPTGIVDYNKVQGSWFYPWDRYSKSVLVPIAHRSKRHYRIVFREVCTTFADEKLLSGALHMLSEACTILKSLHAIGWVHRDISAGNIMVDTLTGVVKLADVEYAKQIGPPSPDGQREVRTGTPAFMAVEVEETTFMFQTRHGESMPEWFYNPNHDLESIWWLYAWSTLNRDIYFVHPASEPRNGSVALPSSTGVLVDPHSRRLQGIGRQTRAKSHAKIIHVDEDQIVPTGLTQETREERVQRIKRQYAFASSLFVQNPGYPERFYVLATELTLKRQVREHRPLHPILRILGDHLCTGRNFLADSYRAAEASRARLFENAADGLHDQLKGLFDAANKSISNLGVQVGVRNLLVEHEKILEAGWIDSKKSEAARAADAARYDAETIRILFGDPDEERSSDCAPGPALGLGEGHAVPSSNRHRKEIRASSSNDEPVQALPALLEEQNVGHSKKRKRALDTDDGDDEVVGNSHSRRRRARNNSKAMADPSLPRNS